MRKTLEMTNLLSLFEVYDSEADAILGAYLGLHSADCTEAQQRVLCVFDSADIRALLGEVLRRAGYKALITGNINDAQILMKATKPRVVVLGATIAAAHGGSAKDALRALEPSATVLVLDDDFASQDPGEAAGKLLDQLRATAAGKSIPA